MTSIAINHPLYVQTVKNLDRVVVRDKLLRLVQYFSRFAAYYAFRKGYSGVAVARLQALVKNLSLARKAFRAGKPLQTLRALVKELSTQTSESVHHYAAITKNLGTSLYLTLDTLQFLNTTGAFKFKPATAKLITDNANRFWLLGIVATIIDAGHSIYVDQQRLAALRTDEKAGSGELKQAQDAYRQHRKLLVWNLLDAIIPLTSLGILKANEGIVGIAGTITAYLGLKDAW